MKKVLLIISIVLILIILTSYIVIKNRSSITNNKINEEVSKPKEENQYFDDNPIVIGLYQKNKTARKLIKEYTHEFTYHEDIVELEVYYTNELTIKNTNQKELFDYYRSNYEKSNDYKIGYFISFKTSSEEFNQTILSPKDTLIFYDYLELYLYDDYHREKGEWYSHTTEDDYTSDTILTSIKLTAGKKVDEVIEDVTISAFTYNDEEDFLNNLYRGNSIYTVTIKK